jgi:GT2 family glycosyltransferase
VVVATLARDRELLRLLDSLERQTEGRIEAVIVDQNGDDRVSDILSQRRWRLPVVHIRTPVERGLSRGRNVGWRRTRGLFVAFADDDCWYPPTLFEAVEAAFRKTEAAVIGGRAADERGQNINGRFETKPQPMNRENVWTTSIEWMLFFRRDVLQAVGGFDESIGVGAHSPWQAAEGQDIVLRALSAGFSCAYDPSLQGHHPEIEIVNPNAAMLSKARGYARGMGFVLRRHGYGAGSMMTWLGRPLAAALIYALKGEHMRVLYYLNVAKGRFEGWMERIP